jgi:UDP-N-acetylmuramoyl-L-alanyl-D-glutamate--2,6-diaminopimelate ligase
MKILKDILNESLVSGISGSLQVQVDGLAYDSRKVKPNYIFFAIRGTKMNGEKFIPQAVENGARVVVVDERSDFTHDQVTVVKTRRVRTLMASMAGKFYNHVDREMKIIGITGTNGKTTTSFLIYHLLKFNYLNPALIGTIEYRLGDSVLPATHTTPESVDLYELFTEALISGSKSIVMEVSSHALDQNRVYGIDFDFGIFTNLSHDHLDYHKTMEQYFQAKQKLFQNQKDPFKMIINQDDEYGRKLVESAEYEVFTYSFSDPAATVSVKKADFKLEGTYLTLNTPYGEMNIISPLIGKFNVYNILATVTFGVAYGFPFENITNAIQNLPQVRGRCEKIDLGKNRVAVIDYAHTPDALKNICETLYSLSDGRLIIVFGCGGDRDKEKRPEMGRIAEEYGDIVIITSDNPRTEDPLKIIDEILGGISEKNRVLIESNRKKAIHMALDMAHAGDVVLIAGKGHETYQEIGTQRYPFDDREEVMIWKKTNGLE